MVIFVPHTGACRAIGPRCSGCTKRTFNGFRTVLTSVPRALNRAVPSFRGVRFHLGRLHSTITAGTTKHMTRIRCCLSRVRGQTSRVYGTRHLCHRNGLPGHMYRYSAGMGGVVFSRSKGILYIVSLSAMVPDFVFSSCKSFLHAKTGANSRSSGSLSHMGFGVRVFGTFAGKCLRNTGSFLAPVRVRGLPCTTTLFPCVRYMHFLTSCVGKSACCGVGCPRRGLMHAGTRFGLLRDMRRRAPRVMTFVGRYLGG